MADDKDTNNEGGSENQDTEGNDSSDNPGAVETAGETAADIIMETMGGDRH